MMCRGVRGATSVEENSREAILRGARQLLALMIRCNNIEADDVGSAIFSVTTDLDAEFPALAACNSAGSKCPCFAPTRSL